MGDSDLLKIGTGFGSFQKRLVALLILSAYPHGLHILVTVFITYTPRHRCFVPGVDDVMTASQNGSGTNTTLFLENSKNDLLRDYIPWNDDTQWWEQCLRYVNTSDVTASDYNSTTDIVVTSPCDHGWIYELEPGVTSASTEYNWVCDRTWYKTLAMTLQMAGMMVGSLVGSLLSDRYGRRAAFLSNYALAVIAISALAFNPLMYGIHVLLFLDGWAIIVRGFAVIVLVTEMLPSKWRDATSVVHTIVFSLGYATLPLIAYLAKDWRWTMAICGGIGLLLLPATLFVPESLGWLLQNNRLKRARKLARRIATVNQMPVDTTKHLFKEFDYNTQEHELKPMSDANATDTNRQDGEERLVVSKPNNSDKLSARRYSYIHLVRYPYLRYRILIYCICWSSVNLCYFGLSLNTNQLNGNRYLNFFFAALVEPPASLLCLFLIRKLGSRIAFAVQMSIAGLLLIVTPLLQNVHDELSVATAVLGKLFVAGGYTLVFTCTGDLFPTLLRNQAYGASSFVSRMVALLVPYILYIGETTDPSIPYIVMVATAITSSAIVLLLPETKGQQLPNTFQESKAFKSSIKCHRRSEA
uniref:solute carrier family 22 member 21-like isoform X2 n=1 Tax=Ciona intestinalis TaxID=7719 RepID=UPI00089DCFCE|nr:solute carrier family 22 member 21-like isoform X2 [Ciona intestinalis]|eukprot:XP_018669261.1 solute carrier family 22 member 21-like isoform X2 [Ciona intestinalis]